jgi:hypothetical protein
MQVAVRGGAGHVIGPQILIGSSNQDENTAIGTTIGTLVVVGGTGTYTLTKTADPDSAFTLTGAVLKNAIVFDYETAISHSVTIHADNGAGSTVNRTLNISVNDIDEVPAVITSSATQSVNENSAFSLTLTADKAVTWTKTGGADTALFTLSGSTLTMTAKDFEIPTDANTDNVYVVQVTATSVAYAPATTNQTINVTVLDVADTLPAPGTPTIVWTSDVTVTPPVFSFTVPTDPDLVVGDTVHFQRATDSGFTTSVTDYTNTVDSAEDLANALTFSSGTWANGTWYVRARTERVGATNSAWSNTETKTLAVVTGVIFDAVSAGGTTASQTYTGVGTSATHTKHTVGTGSHRALIVLVNFGTGSLDPDPASMSVVWDAAGANQAMTIRANSQAAGLNGGHSAQIWALVNPTSGNKTVSLSWTGANESFVTAISFAGVNQTGGSTSFPNATFIRPGTDSPAATVTVSSATGDFVVCTATPGGAISTITGTTIYSDATHGSITDAFANYDAGSASVVIGQANANSTIAACSVKAG